MKNCENSDSVVNQPEVHGVRKRVEQRSSEIGVDYRELHRRSANAVEDLIDRIEEPKSQSRLALLVPARSLVDIRLG